MAGPPGGSPGKSGSSQSFEDGLSSLYTDAARLALAPDAAQHMQFIQLVQKGILQYRQLVQQQKAAAAAHTQSLVAGQAAGMGGDPSAGGPPMGGGGPDMGGGPPGGPGGPPGAPGGAPGGGGPPGQAPPPNQIAPGGGSGMSGYGGVVSPEDLQRVLSGAGGQ